MIYGAQEFNLAMRPIQDGRLGFRADVETNDLEDNVIGSMSALPHQLLKPGPERAHGDDAQRGRRSIDEFGV